MSPSMVEAARAWIAYPSRTRQRLETRDRIFAAALAEFRRVGVAATEIEDIVRAAEVARGTFYLHFPTKDHVLMELLRRQQRDLGERLRASRIASLRGFLIRTVDLMAENSTREPGLHHELFAVIARHANEMRSEASVLVEALMARFAAAQERGEARRDLTSLDLTNVFLPGVYGLLQMKLDAPRAELRQALRRVVDVFVRGIAPTRR
jgi:TetR/AcrR family transcriptional regulator, repressor for uid operon